MAREIKKYVGPLDQAISAFVQTVKFTGMDSGSFARVCYPNDAKQLYPEGDARGPVYLASLANLNAVMKGQLLMALQQPPQKAMSSVLELTSILATKIEKVLQVTKPEINLTQPKGPALTEPGIVAKDLALAFIRNATTPESLKQEIDADPASNPKKGSMPSEDSLLMKVGVLGGALGKWNTSMSEHLPAHISMQKEAKEAKIVPDSEQGVLFAKINDAHLAKKMEIANSSGKRSFVGDAKAEVGLLKASLDCMLGKEGAKGEVIRVLGKYGQIDDPDPQIMMLAGQAMAAALPSSAAPLDASQAPGFSSKASEGQESQQDRPASPGPQGGK